MISTFIAESLFKLSYEPNCVSLHLLASLYLFLPTFIIIEERSDLFTSFERFVI